MECEMPKVNSNTQEIIEYFKNTQTIAVVGASPKPDKDSHKVAKYLLEVGYNMIPIYPKESEILGQRVYKSLKEIDQNIDMVVVFRKPDVVDAIVEACIERGDVKVLWTQIGIINNPAANKAKEAGINVVQNYCAMVEHRELMA
ncbi:MAG: CoA-binding protein [Campylobacterota bacterium]|nr:CoA-binding protein [Campylobacterota bacterium]